MHLAFRSLFEQVPSHIARQNKHHQRTARGSFVAQRHRSCLDFNRRLSCTLIKVNQNTTTNVGQKSQAKEFTVTDSHCETTNQQTRSAEVTRDNTFRPTRTGNRTHKHHKASVCYPSAFSTSLITALPTLSIVFTPSGSKQSGEDWHAVNVQKCTTSKTDSFSSLFIDLIYLLSPLWWYSDAYRRSGKNYVPVAKAYTWIK